MDHSFCMMFVSLSYLVKNGPRETFLQSFNSIETFKDIPFRFGSVKIVVCVRE